MFGKLSKTSDIKKILIFSLTNIGDVILTLPVADILLRDFPKAKVSIIIGPKARSLFSDGNRFEKVYVFDKAQPKSKTWRAIRELSAEKFDLVVDLRNSPLPYLLASKYRTSFLHREAKHLHMKEKHLRRLKSVYPFDNDRVERSSIFVSDDDRKIVSQHLERFGLKLYQFVVMAPGAAYPGKRWSEAGFACVADSLNATYGLKTIFVGDQSDWEIAGKIQQRMSATSSNLCGKLSLTQCAELFRRSRCALTNDSAPMHLASYMNVPVIALFGPSEPKKYGPWGEKGYFLQAGGDKEAHQSIERITSHDVLRIFNTLLKGHHHARR